MNVGLIVVLTVVISASLAFGGCGLFLILWWPKYERWYYRNQCTLLNSRILNGSEYTMALRRFVLKQLGELQEPITADELGRFQFRLPSYESRRRRYVASGLFFVALGVATGVCGVLVVVQAQ